MKIRRLIVLLVFSVVSCQSDAPPPPAIPPARALLIFPEQNAVCTEGTVISATQSAIVFTWNSSANTDIYEVTIKNLTTGLTSTHVATEPRLEITLSRNAPYSWFVVSKSYQVGTTTKSDVWKFYNAGPGIISYAPYPAEIIFPVIGQQIDAPDGTVTLDWTGADADEDLMGFDIYFGTTTSPALLKSDHPESNVPVAVTAGQTYYWRIITKDAQGNTSNSGLYQFRVN
ncbi:MAG TPA: hypothetical protein VGE26_06860 [Sphingobacteriaceae bacterium]